MIIERTHLACTTGQMRPRMLIDASRPLSLSAQTCSVADVCFVYKRYTTSISIGWFVHIHGNAPMRISHFSNLRKRHIIIDTSFYSLYVITKRYHYILHGLTKFIHIYIRIWKVWRTLLRCMSEPRYDIINLF